MNQFAKRVQQGKLPKLIIRVDKGNPNHGEKNHVHFKGGAALNQDGTWKHTPKDGDFRRIFTKEVKQTLLQYGWKLPEGIEN